MVLTLSQEDYLSEIAALTPTQQEELIDSLMCLGSRMDLYDRNVKWEELPIRCPVLGGYNVPTLRHYVQLFGSLRLLQDVEVDDEGFTQKGFTEWGKMRKEKGRRIGFFILNFLAYFGAYYLIGLLRDFIYTLR